MDNCWIQGDEAVKYSRMKRATSVNDVPKTGTTAG